MNTGQIQIRSASGQTWQYPLEKSQFSIAGIWENDGWALEVKNLFYFRGEGPHEINTPLEQLGPLFSFRRSITPEEIIAKGLIRTLIAEKRTFESKQIPYPAGTSFGSCHLAVSEMTYSMAWLNDWEFRCEVHGTLKRIHDDPRNLHASNFVLAIDPRFDGIWLESANPADKPRIESFCDAVFGELKFTKSFDLFDDAVVLRALPASR